MRNMVRIEGRNDIVTVKTDFVEPRVVIAVL